MELQGCVTLKFRRVTVSCRMSPGTRRTLGSMTTSYWTQSPFSSTSMMVFSTTTGSLATYVTQKKRHTHKTAAGDQSYSADTAKAVRATFWGGMYDSRCTMPKCHL